MNLTERFPKKRIVITGAGSGLGKALALEFAKMNWNIAVADIHRARAKESVLLINKIGGQGIDIHCDVAKPDDLVNVANVVKREWGGVDILINNAGIAAAGYFEKILLETWDWIINVDLKSVIYGCRTFVPLFKEQGHGYIVNVASSSGIASLPEMSCHNVPKAAVISLSETLKVELAPFNIGVTVVCPTFIKTNLMDQFISTDTRQREMWELFFDKSAATAEEVAQHVVRSIGKSRFYVITQKDGRFVWRMKRWYPELYFKVFSYIYKKGYFDRYLGTFLRVLNFKLF